ncbi:MAG: hypothetical protein RIC18_10730, partial [Hoeflea sp.]
NPLSHPLVTTPGKPFNPIMLHKQHPLVTLDNAGIHRAGRWLVRGVSPAIPSFLTGFSRKPVNDIEMGISASEPQNGTRP